MNEQQELFRKLKIKVLKNLMEMRDLLEVPTERRTLYIVNQIYRVNDTLRYYLEPIRRPAGVPRLDFTKLDLVYHLLGSPVVLTKSLEGTEALKFERISD